MHRPALHDQYLELHDGRGRQNNYSEFAFAGGPVGVVAPVFANWQETFWQNLQISVDLHWVTRVVGMTHRDCGAAAVAYGDRVKTDWDYETEVLSSALRTFRTGVQQREPGMLVELGIMDVDGNVESVD